MIIKNFKDLATTKTRKDALEIINAGIKAVLTKSAMHKHIKLNKNNLQIYSHYWNISKFNRILVIGAGKASGDMAQALEEILGTKIAKGIVIDTQKRTLSRIQVIKGTHPLPSKINLKTTNEIINVLKESNNDLIINLISGGGSALLESPRIPLSQYLEITKKLLKSGATIQEINTIRKHLSYIKGGQLARLASKSTIITLIMSDVITNDLHVIASGPTVRDTTTLEDVKLIQKKYQLPNLPFAETPKEQLTNVTNILLITNIPAAEAMKLKAKALGYFPKILTTQLKGEARIVGKNLTHLIKPKTALIATGETTVIVKGKGKGGRNQELALAAIPFIKKGVLISCSSDGVDFITEAAGGIIDETTKAQAKKKKINIQKYLNNNDSYNALKKLNGIIITGKTGTNVSDIMLALGKK